VVVNPTAFDEEGAKTVSTLKPGLSGRHSKRGRGQAMVEFALVIPMFLLILAAIIDFGFGFFDRMSVINAAREGARAGVMVDVANAPSTMQRTVMDRVESAAAQGGITVTDSNVQVTCVQTNATTSSPCTFTVHSAANLAGVQSGDSVSVTVNYSYHISFPMLTVLGITTLDLSSTVQMVIE
jgi:Flp pilus assembly protein TadG